ncbi:MAG: IS66 family transposase [Opitutaceae bacterium]|nr:IS66 family transposase [Opitutaceae bacterium]
MSKSGTEKSRPVLARIEQMLLGHLHAVVPSSLLGKALH